MSARLLHCRACKAPRFKFDGRNSEVVKLACERHAIREVDGWCSRSAEDANSDLALMGELLAASLLGVCRDCFHAGTRAALGLLVSLHIHGRAA